MNKSIIKPLITLATVSFMLTLSHYGAVKPVVNASEYSINTAAVDESVNIKSQFNAPESNRTANAAAGLSAGITVVGILSLIKAKNSFKFSSPAPHSSSKPSSQSKEKTIRLDQARRELQKKLLSLLHNDLNTASRLLSHVEMKNPGRSINWYVEKVIYDLERDRGRW